MSQQHVSWAPKTNVKTDTVLCIKHRIDLITSVKSVSLKNRTRGAYGRAVENCWFVSLFTIIFLSKLENFSEHPNLFETIQTDNQRKILP